VDGFTVSQFPPLAVKTDSEYGTGELLLVLMFTVWPAVTGCPAGPMKTTPAGKGSGSGGVDAPAKSRTRTT
jgi:hypothetical protein